MVDNSSVDQEPVQVYSPSIEIPSLRISSLGAPDATSRSL